MKNLLLIVTLATFLSSCSISENIENSPVGLVSLDGYSKTIKGNADQFHVITSDAQFNDLFVANTVVSKKPDFDGQVAVSLTADNQKFHFTRATINSKEMNVYYEIGKGSPVTIATVPKCQTIKRVNFFQDSYLVRTIDVSIP